jgi:regulator of sigma D
MKRLYDYLNKQSELLIEMIEHSKYELENFHTFSANKIYELSEYKEEMMLNFISLKGEIDIYVENHSDEIEENKKMIIKIQDNMEIFKLENKKLMLVTMSMKRLYDDISEKTENSAVIDMEI